jgi:hypothetical protein
MFDLIKRDVSYTIRSFGLSVFFLVKALRVIEYLVQSNNVCFILTMYKNCLKLKGCFK